VRVRCGSPRGGALGQAILQFVRVAVLDDYFHRAHEFADWDSLDAEVSFLHEPIPQERLAAELAGFDVLVLMRERTAFPREVLEQLPRLALVVTTGMRNASLDVEYLRHRGVPVSGTTMDAPDAGVPTTVEDAWALILSVLKRVTLEDRAIRAGLWQEGMPSTLAGLALGLAGLGRLGAAMVAPARAFGMDVIAWSQNLTEERAQAVGAAAVSKERLLSDSDVLSIHLVLSDRTRGLFGAAELASMKPTAVLINTSRGPIVDEQALIVALRERRIAAAGLDVFDQEPLPAGHELTTLENTVLLPHLGYVGEDTFRSMYAQAVEDIAAHLRGQPIRLLD
jgi:phosphoglycerate dehydrogenase-like enzyme